MVLEFRRSHGGIYDQISPFTLDHPFSGILRGTGGPLFRVGSGRLSRSPRSFGPAASTRVSVAVALADMRMDDSSSIPRPVAHSTERAHSSAASSSHDRGVGVCRGFLAAFRDRCVVRLGRACTDFGCPAVGCGLKRLLRCQRFLRRWIRRCTS